MQTTRYWKNDKKRQSNTVWIQIRVDVEKGVDLKNIRISVDRALVLKVRVFETRKWPILISDWSWRIKVYRPGLYRLNRDRAGRSPELLCVLSTRSYFTLASVVLKDIMVQFRKRTLWRQKFNHILYWWGLKLFVKRRIWFWYPLARISVAAKKCEDLLLAQREKT